MKSMMKNFIIALSVLFTANVYAGEDTSDASYYPNGFKMQIERSTWGINVAKDLDIDTNNRYVSFASGLSINFGYQQNAHLYYGGGIGYRLKSEDFFDDFFLSIPVYGDIRIYASDQKVVPYMGLKIGYCFNVIGKEDQDFEIYQDDEGGYYYNTHEYQYKMKGLYIRPEVGVRIKKVGIAIGIPIVEKVREQIKYNNQRLSTTEHKKTGFDVGVNLIVSYNFCF